MSSFLEFLDDKGLKSDNLHQHFFGGIGIQRRGRLKWKIGITRQIIAQRRSRGVDVDAFFLPLARYKQIYRIKRSVRLWQYLFRSLRFRNPYRSDKGMWAKRLFNEFDLLHKYLQRRMDHIYPCQHSILLCETNTDTTRLKIPHVEDLETKRKTDLAVERAFTLVIEHTTGPRGLAHSCIQGYIDDTVDHAVECCLDEYFEAALHIVEEPDAFVTLEWLQSSESDDAEGSVAIKAFTDRPSSVKMTSQQVAVESIEGTSDTVDAMTADMSSIASIASDRSYLLSSHRSMRPNVLISADPIMKQKNEDELLAHQDALTRENEALRRMLSALAVNPEEPPAVKKGTKMVKFDLTAAATSEMSLSELDQYLNEASVRASDKGGNDDGYLQAKRVEGTLEAGLEDSDSMVQGFDDFKADAPIAAHPPSISNEGCTQENMAEEKYDTQREDMVFNYENESKDVLKDLRSKRKNANSSNVTGSLRTKRLTWEEKEEERKANQRRMRRLLLLSKAEDHMRAVEEEYAKAKGTWKTPKRERLLSDVRTLPERDLVATNRVAKQVILGVRSKVSAGNPEVVNKKFGLTERKLMESPFGTPFADKYREKIEKEERERKKAELLAFVNGKGKKTS